MPALGAEPLTAPSITGQTGLLNMPDARIAPEGTWRTGISFMRPYQTIWSSLAVFPWLEGSFRYTRIMDVPGFPGGYPGGNLDYGDYKDKSFDLKLQLLPERGIWPSVAFGAQDVQGTAIFRALYGAASKQIGNFDLTLGYGSKRIDGAFGGVRYTDPRLPNWSLVAEYDAYNYKLDHGAALSGAADYKKAPAAGIEYRSTWWGAKAYAAHGQAGVNAWLSVPLEAKDFVPKLDEPPPFTKIVPRPTEAQWAENREHRAQLVRALYEQDFRDVRLAYVNGVLSARLANIRISSMPRAVGRAARTLLSFAPLEVREIRVTYLEAKLPLATYEFVDVPLLQRYFNGMASRAKLAQTVSIEYAKPGGNALADREAMLSAFEEPIPERLLVQRGVEGSMLSVRDEDVLGGTLLLHPSLQAYFNDPSGALKFDVSAVASYERWLPAQVQLLGDLKLSLWENVSDVTQPSNSLLPHVRTDVADYKRESKPKILRLLANKYFQPAERVYARVSGGIYEEMYDGVGGQVLYLPGDGRWAADLAVDALKQRDFRGLFGTRDYSTVTAIASLNYRMAHGLTATARAGRFLAKDEGVRFEMKRRFRSGLRGRRLVHLHQRQRHHLARHALEPVPRQGHLHGDAARHHADQGHARGGRHFACALDARRGADGGLARRPVRAHRARRDPDARARRARALRRHGRRLHPARRSAPARASGAGRTSSSATRKAWRTPAAASTGGRPRSSAAAPFSPRARSTRVRIGLRSIIKIQNH